MAEEFTKPGTANVSPADLKKLAPLMRHYAAMAHPFTVCKRDQMKHGLPEDHANRRCAVLKDLIRGTTKWRGTKEARDLGLADAPPMDELALLEFDAWNARRTVVAEGLLRVLDDPRASGASRARAVETAIASLDDRGVLAESARDPRSLASATARMLREQLAVGGALAEQSASLRAELEEAAGDGEHEAMVAKLTKKGVPKPVAEKMARKAVAKKRRAKKVEEADSRADHPAISRAREDDGPYWLVEADLTAERRRELAKKGHAMSDGSFPIPNVAYLRKAIKAFGRAGDKGKAKAWIIKRARALGATSLLPSSWGVSSSAKEAALEEALDARDAAREAGDGRAYYRALARERVLRERARAA